MDDKKLKANKLRRTSVGKLPSDPVPVTDPNSYKYQTIQSFRPDEVKELLNQHFARIRQETTGGDNSIKHGAHPGVFSEDGRRRFSLVRSNFRNARRSVKLNDSPETRTRDRVGSKDDLKAVGREKSDSTGSREDIQILQMGSGNDSPRVAGDFEEISLAQELEEKDKVIAELKEQLERERVIFSDELNRLREKQKRFKLKMLKQQEKLDSLLVLVETRERAIQQLYNPSSSPISGSPTTSTPLS